MVTILMMPAKLASPGLLTIKIFQNKGYDVIIPDYDVTNKILSRTSNYIVDVVMWQSLITIAFLWEKLSWRQFYKDLTWKTVFLRSGLGLRSIISDWH